MSQGTVMIQTQSRQFEKDFTVATPEEFVHRFGGTNVINKVLCNSRNSSVLSCNMSEEKSATFKMGSSIKIKFCDSIKNFDNKVAAASGS